MKSIIFNSVKEAEQSINRNSELGFILHVPIDMIHDLGKQSSENTVLVSTSGEYSGNGYQSGVITGFSYDKSIGESVEIQDPPILSKSNIESAYNKVKNNPNAFMLLYLDGLSGGEERVMTTLYFMKDDFKIIGGSAGDDLRFKETIIYLGNKQVTHAAVFINAKSKTQLVKENIYVPHGEKVLITDADPIKRIVYKINNRPATTEYARLLGISESDLANHFMNNPLGKIYEDEILIASPQAVNPDKSITFYCQLMPNTFVYMLQPVDPVTMVNETMDSLSFTPSFMYVVNCILRSLKFQEENTWKPIDRCVSSKCKNMTGFISYGEQYYKHHVNQTMVILAVE